MVLQVLALHIGQYFSCRHVYAALFRDLNGQRNTTVAI